MNYSISYHIYMPQAKRHAPLFNITHRSQADAISLDHDLMSPAHGFSIDTLMELAGLSCASALSDAYPLPAAK